MGTVCHIHKTPLFIELPRPLRTMSFKTGVSTAVGLVIGMYAIELEEDFPFISCVLILVLTSGEADEG